MKTSYFHPVLLVLLLHWQPTFAQNQPLLASATIEPQASTIFNQKANFPNLEKYLQDHVDYPELAQKNGVEGTVTVEAQLGEDGEILSVALYNGIGFGCDEALMALVSNMPNWTPAIKNGEYVPQIVFIRARFRLQ